MGRIGGAKMKNKKLLRIAQIIESGLDFGEMLTATQKKNVNTLWIYDVLKANLSGVKRIKLGGE